VRGPSWRGGGPRTRGLRKRVEVEGACWRGVRQNLGRGGVRKPDVRRQRIEMQPFWGFYGDGTSHPDSVVVARGSEPGRYVEGRRLPYYAGCGECRRGHPPRAGSFWGGAGPSGSGKSRSCTCWAGLDHPNLRQACLFGPASTFSPPTGSTDKRPAANMRREKIGFRRPVFFNLLRDGSTARWKKPSSSAARDPPQSGPDKGMVR